ncbi:sulfite exporter TauE/SafE family protein [Lachnospiraceae bacterium NSJ-143]|nr:sulfite exporter TauE/SafE family protein [Lachnospiraceae bacterium NSJ-143]
MDKKKTLIFGLITGLVNGVFGSGGGVAAVYVLEKYGRLEAKKSHATAVGVILPVSVVSAAVYLFKADIMIKSVLITSAGGIIGGVIGAVLLSKVSNKIIHRIFGIFMIVSAVRMIMI